MDPQATWEQLLAAYAAGDWDLIEERATDQTANDRERRSEHFSVVAQDIVAVDSDARLAAEVPGDDRQRRDCRRVTEERRS